MKQKGTIAKRVTGKSILQVGPIAIVKVSPKRKRVVKAPPVVEDPNQLPLFSSDGVY